MRLPSEKVKIKGGQIWKKRESLDHPYHIVIIKKARSKHGRTYFHTVRLENRNTAHAIAEGDIWRFYDMIGYGK